VQKYKLLASQQVHRDLGLRILFQRTKI